MSDSLELGLSKTGYSWTDFLDRWPIDLFLSWRHILGTGSFASQKPGPSKTGYLFTDFLDRWLIDLFLSVLPG